MPIKVLWISNFAPVSSSADAGSKTFKYYYDQFCSDERFDVRLISCGFYKNKDAIEIELEGKNHRIIYWNDPTEGKLSKAKNIESKYNPLNRYCNLLSNTTVKKIKQTVNGYAEEGYAPDVVILEWTHMVLLSSWIKEIYPKAKIVASEHDVMFIGYERKSQYYKGFAGAEWRLKYKREKRKEIEALMQCDLILPHNASNVDVLSAEGLSPKKMQWLVPFFQDMTSSKRSSNGRDILFFGAMGRPENYLSAIWFIEKVMPLLADLDVRFVILGNRPPEELSKYESQRVHITGFVVSIVPFFEQSMCFAASLVLGAGIKVKVLEAMSSGIPVLTNDVGIEGILAKNGQDYIHCETPEEYETAIRKIISDEQYGSNVGDGGRRFIEKHFSYADSAERYKNRMIELLKQ